MNYKIKDDLRASLGIDCREVTPVDGGWLNKKWKAETDRGTLLIKQYSHKRFSLAGIDQIEAALFRQMKLAEDGLPCPRIFTIDGHPIRRLNDDIAYMVMEFCPGVTGDVGSVTEKQLVTLGHVTAQMKRGFAAMDPVGAKDYPMDCGARYAELLDNYRRHTDRLTDDAPEEYRRALSAQEKILQWLSPAYFAGLAKGLAHEDFSPDNMLFDATGVTAILDFDRCRYGFVLHDIGRILMSLAFSDGVLDVSRIRAFMAGYRELMPLTDADIADALRVTWCVEVMWWIQPGLWRDPKPKLRRFRDELCWLTENFTRLDAWNHI